ncbi:hypothetical protein RSAG8_04912, partial [Rhizoctonia solani AG-8 WAC10335]
MATHLRDRRRACISSSRHYYDTAPETHYHRVAHCVRSSGQSSTTHYTRALGPKQVKVRSYHPETTFKTYGITGIDHPLSKRGIHASSSDAAKSFLVSETGTHSDEVAHRTGYTSNGISNEYFHQRLNGIRVANAVANVAIKGNNGNNVLSYAGGTSGTTSQSSPTNIYDYIRNPNLTPSEGPNPDAARTNVFYIANMYRYGFTEKTWNYQQDNRGLGGLGNDRVEIEVQSNYPGLITVPADGRPAKIYLGTWSQGDGAFQNDITVHELMHGVVGRLTGGGTAKCFTTTEAHGLDEGWADSHGLDEGWADAFPNLIQRTSAADRDFSIARWANGKNLRTYPYSTNKSVNPRMYGDAGTASDTLAIAELWAVLWHEITVSLIKERGFTSNLFDPRLTSGNTITLHLMIDGLIAQPCNPTFISARDAIIQADATRYNGANKCTLWKAFAKRGVGYGKSIFLTDSSRA